MAYRLKSVRYMEADYWILLQNENGPCPLIAAANALILGAKIRLPSNCVGAGVIKIDELVNVLAEYVLTSNQGGNTEHHVQEVLEIFPSLQFGMDLNPKLASGPSSVEYTKELDAFDLLHVNLFHGWLVDPEQHPEEFQLIGSKTYNELVNIVIKGNEAQHEMEKLTREQSLDVEKEAQLSLSATQGMLIHRFLEHSSHQLTQYGLQVLHERVKEGDLCVFFRNNHFNTLTNHKGQLYLLVTDLGFATLGDVVWEKLDVIDGDTEYVSAQFSRPALPPMIPVSDAATGQQLVENNIQAQADYHLALQLSRETSSNPSGAAGKATQSTANTDMEAAIQASLAHYHQAQKSGDPVEPKAQATSVPQQSVTASAPVALPDRKPPPPSSTETNEVYDTPTVVQLPPPASKNPEMVAIAIPASGDGDALFARQMQQQADEEASRMLAMQLDRQEKQRAANHRQRAIPRQTTPAARPQTARAQTASSRSGDSSACIIC